MPRKYTPEEQIAAFWSRVDRSAGPSACWPWLGGTHAGGYGTVAFRGRVELVHRVVWYLTYGDWPVDCVLHSCDNPPCCNPTHLFEGGRLENARDRKAKGRNGPRPRLVPGEHHPSARLSNADVAAIRARFTGRRGQQQELAQEYGVSRTHVCGIINGRQRQRG